MVDDSVVWRRMANTFFLLLLLLLPICSSGLKQQEYCRFLGAAEAYVDGGVSRTNRVRGGRFLKGKTSRPPLWSSSSTPTAFISTHATTCSFRRQRSQRVAGQYCAHPLQQKLYKDGAEQVPLSVPNDLTSSPILPPLEDGIPPFLQLQKGTDEGLYVVDTYRVPREGIDVSQFGVKNGSIATKAIVLDPARLERLGITAANVTLPIALMVWDPTRYPSLSRARKACRQGKIVLLSRHEEDDDPGDKPPIQKVKLMDRLYPGDIIGRQDSQARILLLEDMNTNTTTNTPVRVWKTLLQTTDMINLKRPPFRLGVVYQDDFMAIVNKPAGVLVYAEGGKGMNNVRFAALQVLQPPLRLDETDSVMDRPEPVHRLDFATSGLLVLGKTKSSVSHLAQQFEFRRVQKTYTAIVRGIPDGVKHNKDSKYTFVDSQRLTQQQALDMGFLTAEDAASNTMDVSTTSTMDHDSFKIQDDMAGNDSWNLLHTVLDGKNATTLWRILATQRNKNNTFVSVIQLLPKTGRYHQLRRHMAWVYNTPIVGDPIHDVKDGGSSHDQKNPDETTTSTMGKNNNTANKRYHRGLMLCANRIRLLHPYFNTEEGRKEWHRAKLAAAAADTTFQQERPTVDDNDTHRTQTCIANGELYEHDGNVFIHASIDLPEKFQKCLEMAEKRAKYNSL